MNTVAELTGRELDRYAADHKRSGELRVAAAGHLLSGVPMNWMTRWPGAFPVVFATATGASLTDVDGNAYVDFCLGDTGAMAGHCPAPTVAATAAQLERGITTMLPSEDAGPVGAELGRRFGLRHWQFTLSATDANRFAIRLCREITGKPKVLVFDHCYHGSVDETFAELDTDGRVVAQLGNVGPPVPLAETTRVVEWGDVDGLERELAAGDVACILTEPALTNVGIVLPEPGFHAALRELSRAAEALLIIDETHTMCCGPGGYTGAHGLEPDLLTVGKAIAGGVPIGAYGMTDAVAERVLAKTIWEVADVGGIGGTLAGNALSLAATRATLDEVLTEPAFERMIALGERFAAGCEEVIAEFGLPWQATRLGCRVEYMFNPTPPRSGGEAAAAFDSPLDALLHLYMLNRGVLMTPFHMMALMSPATTEFDVDTHTAALREFAAELTG
ncbi:MAG TPA: transaminase [Solirubrobacterales bacterium]|nr:transaminase [Solirubrobacterales bacterium]